MGMKVSLFSSPRQFIVRAVHYPQTDKYSELQQSFCGSMVSRAPMENAIFRYLIKGLASNRRRYRVVLNRNEIILMELMALFSRARL